MPRIQFNMRIDQDIKSMLDDVAQSQNRTTANLIELIFKQYVDQVAKRTSSPSQELEFASNDDLHSVLSQRRPAVVDTLKYLEDK